MFWSCHQDRTSLQPHLVSHAQSCGELSTETGFHASVRATCEALGIHALLKDVGQELQACVHIEVAATHLMIEREGLARVRHIHVHILWFQGHILRRRLPLQTMLGTTHPADLMTNNFTMQDIDKYVSNLNLYFKEVRANLPS